jgi:hypothetical protein
MIALKKISKCESSKWEQTAFIAKHIDARISLSRVGVYDPRAFVDESMVFAVIVIALPSACRYD